MIEVKNPTGIRLTQGDDGIFLHFKSKGKSAGIELSALLHILNQHTNILNPTLKLWVDEQFSIENRMKSDSEVTTITHTTISCKYTEGCCGCLDIIYSSNRQQIEVKCNECGKTFVIMNSEGYLVS
jgi:hypothetical protein